MCLFCKGFASVVFVFPQVCMDILVYIIQCTQPPLSEPLLNSVFPVVVNTILASDDNSVLQVHFVTWDGWGCKFSGGGGGGKSAQC